MDHQKKAAMLIEEALPYLQKFHGQIVVIKYGGKAMVNEDLQHSVMNDIAFLKTVGMLPVVVYGGGPEISNEMEKRGLTPRFVNGLRVTDEKTVKIIKKIFTQIGVRIQDALSLYHVKSKTVMECFDVRQKDEALGFVGEVTSVHAKKIMRILRSQKIPIIAPMGKLGRQTYNLNADTAATEVAIALKAAKLTILTDVDGVINKGVMASTLSIKEAKRLISKGVITKGMIPKVDACIRAVQAGCKKAHLLNGTTPHSLLFEIFTEKGIGTEIVK